MDITLWKGDCLELMKDIPDNSVDLILCDLPYGTTKNRWDVIIPFDLLWAQYERIIKGNCAILLFGQNLFSAKIVLSNEKMYRYNIIWEKTKSGGFLNARRMPLASHEIISVFYKKLPKYNPQMKKGNPYIKKAITNGDAGNYGKFERIGSININNGTRFPRDVIKFSNDNHNSFHPTQKPVELLEWLIKSYSNEGDIVLDNTMGSGSTGVACVNTNRRFIGIEKGRRLF